MKLDKTLEIIYRDDPFWAHVRWRWGSPPPPTKTCRTCGATFRPAKGCHQTECWMCADGKGRRVTYGVLAETKITVRRRENGV